MALGPGDCGGGPAGRLVAAHGPAPQSLAPPRRSRAGPPGPATMRRLPRAALLPLQLALLVAAGAPEAPVSAPRSLVWGPGLRAGVVLPVRYFYLQAVNSEGQNLTRSPPGSVEPPASAPPAARAPGSPPRVLAGPAPLPLGSPPAACVAPLSRRVSPCLGSGHLPCPRLPGHRGGRASLQKSVEGRKSVRGLSGASGAGAGVASGRRPGC